MAQYGDVTIAFYSDNGTNFCGVDNALRQMYTKNVHQKYQRYYRPRKISWYFNTPLANPQGGAWECLICSRRHLLSHVPYDQQHISVFTDVLGTMLAGAHKIINARSLTPVRASIEGYDVISPSSLLHHHSVKPMNPVGTLPSTESFISDHQNVRDRVDVF